MKLSAIVLAAGLVWVSAGSRVQAEGTPLPGTQPLTLEQPLDVVMVDGIDRFCLKAIADSRAARAAKWTLDTTSTEAYLQSVKANRQRFRTIIGAVDVRVPTTGLELEAAVGRSTGIAESPVWTAHPVRWRVLEGVTGVGLYFKPKRGPALARVIALPDADWTPEQFAGLAEGLPAELQAPRTAAWPMFGIQVGRLATRRLDFALKCIRMSILKFGHEWGRNSRPNYGQVLTG